MPLFLRNEVLPNEETHINKVYDWLYNYFEQKYNASTSKKVSTRKIDKTISYLIDEDEIESKLDYFELLPTTPGQVRNDNSLARQLDLILEAHAISIHQASKDIGVRYFIFIFFIYFSVAVLKSFIESNKTKPENFKKILIWMKELLKMSYDTSMASTILVSMYSNIIKSPDYIENIQNNSTKQGTVTIATDEGEINFKFDKSPDLCVRAVKNKLYEYVATGFNIDRFILYKINEEQPLDDNDDLFNSNDKVEMKLIISAPVFGNTN